MNSLLRALRHRSVRARAPLAQTNRPTLDTLFRSRGHRKPIRTIVYVDVGAVRKRGRNAPVTPTSTPGRSAAPAERPGTIQKLSQIRVPGEGPLPSARPGKVTY